MNKIPKNIINRGYRVILVALIVLFVSKNSYAQVDSTSIGLSLKDNIEIDKNQNSHSPQKSLIFSAVLPGLGQLYNHQAWKIPIVYAGLGAGGYYIYNNYSEMRKFKQEYLYRVNHEGHTNLQGYESYPDQNIYNLYESYNKSFQLGIFIELAVYGLNLIDAYVFGHLFDFDISDDISLNFFPSCNNSEFGMQPGISISFSF